MARVLVLGAAGLLGHHLFAHLAESGGGCVGTISARHAGAVGASLARFGRLEVIDDVRDTARVRALAEEVNAEVVVNCVAAPARSEAGPVDQIERNALLPHRLAADVCDAVGARLVQIGTDAVFDGTGGPYDERSPISPNGHYGCAKALGEVTHGAHVTLRTSLYGRELTSRRGLVEWLLASSGRVSGYRNVVFSGASAPALSRFIVEWVIGRGLSGVVHVGAAPVSKYELLCLIAEAFAHSVDVVPVDEPRGAWVLRTSRPDLDGARFPSHRQMAQELADASRSGRFPYAQAVAA